MVWLCCKVARPKLCRTGLCQCCLHEGCPLTGGASRQPCSHPLFSSCALLQALTVYETLYFAAMLRLPRTFTTAQKVERINSVIRALGLEKCRNTIIGGFFRRGVSGGERKASRQRGDWVQLHTDPKCRGSSFATAAHPLGWQHSGMAKSASLATVLALNVTLSIACVCGVQKHVSQDFFTV